MAGGKWELREAVEEPGERILAAAGGVEPARPRDVGFDVGIFFEERNETRPGVATGPLGSVVVPIVIPGDVDIAGDAAHEPVGDVEGKSVLHGGAGDAGGIEIVEQGQVGIRRAKFLDAFVKRVEKTFDARDERRPVRKRAEEEQAFV